MDLRSYEIFHDFTKQQFKKVKKLVHVIKLSAGKVFVHEASVDERIFLLIKGEVEVIKVPKWHKEVQKITTLKPKNIIGERSLIDHKPRSALFESMRKELEQIKARIGLEIFSLGIISVMVIYTLIAGLCWGVDVCQAKKYVWRVTFACHDWRYRIFYHWADVDENKYTF